MAQGRDKFREVKHSYANTPLKKRENKFANLLVIKLDLLKTCLIDIWYRSFINHILILFSF